MIEQHEIPVPTLGAFIAIGLLSLYWIATYPIRFWTPRTVTIKTPWRAFTFKTRLPEDPAWCYRAEERLAGGGFRY